MRRLSRAAALALALAVPAVLLSALPSAAQDDAQLVDLEGRDVGYWHARISDAHARVDEARRRHAAAETAYKDMRQRRRPRGEAKAKIEQEYEAAKIELAEAEHELEALFEEARRAGAPPGWLRSDG